MSVTLVNGCISQSTAKRWGKVILYSALLRHWNTQASSGLHSAREMNILEWVQQRAMKVIEVLKHWHWYEESLSRWELFSLETRPREILSMFINTWEREVKRHKYLAEAHDARCQWKYSVKNSKSCPEASNWGQYHGQKGRALPPRAQSHQAPER